MSTNPHQAETNQESAGAAPAGIILTAKAAEQVRTIRERENLGENLLRISIVGGGCSGMSYRMGFIEEAQEHDQVIEQDGVRLVVDPKSYLYLNGTTIDFRDGLDGTGFTFSNPNAQRTCGCGSSFSA